MIDPGMSVAAGWLAAEAAAKSAEVELAQRTRQFWMGIGEEPTSEEIRAAKVMRVKSERLFDLLLLEMDRTIPKYFTGRHALQS